MPDHSPVVLVLGASRNCPTTKASPSPASSWIVNLLHGAQPFRTDIHPSKNCSKVVSAVADRIRSEFYHRVGIEDLLSSNAAR